MFVRVCGYVCAVCVRVCMRVCVCARCQHVKSSESITRTGRVGVIVVVVVSDADVAVGDVVGFLGFIVSCYCHVRFL